MDAYLHADDPLSAIEGRSGASQKRSLVHLAQNRIRAFQDAIVGGPRRASEAGALLTSIRRICQAAKDSRVRCLRSTKPRAPMPSNIIAHVVGSGTAPIEVVVSDPPALIGIDG